MKIVCVAPSNVRYSWEMELLMESLSRTGYNTSDVIWLSYGVRSSIARLIIDKYGCEYHHYKDDRPSKKYASSIRPWLIARYLMDHPTMSQEKIVYVDSDIIIPQYIDFDAIPTSPHQWYGSETPYASLSKSGVNYGYDTIIKDSVGLSDAMAEEFYPTIPGCQWVLDSVQPQFMMDVYEASENIYHRIVSDITAREHMVINPWIADMWAFPLVAKKHGITCSPTEKLAFTIADDPVDRFDKCPIYHNSGVNDATCQRLGIFDKTAWNHDSPLGHVHVVSPQYCSYKFLMFMQSVDPFTEVIDIDIDTKEFSALWNC